jgi:hypothetical protein
MIRYLRWIAAVVASVLPYGGDYKLAVIGCFAGFCLISKDVTFKKSYVIYLYIILCLFFLPGILINLNYLTNFWDLRHITFLMLLAMLGAIRSKRRIGAEVEYSQLFPWVLASIISFDLFFLNLDFAGFSRDALLLITNENFKEYVDGYYRYLGIFGNPNVSGVFYALAFFYFAENRNISRIVSIAVCLMSLYMLILTFSRTAFISLLLAYLITSRLNLRVLIGLFLGSLTIYYVVAGDLNEIFISRVTDFSSAEDRSDILLGQLYSMTPVVHLFGTPTLPTVTDNDFLTIYIRFGLFGLLGYLTVACMLIYIIAKTPLYRELKMGLLCIALTSGFAGGALGNPQLMFVVFLIIQSISQFYPSESPKKYPDMSGKFNLIKRP